jgi:hypothetical protein
MSFLAGAASREYNAVAEYERITAKSKAMLPESSSGNSADQPPTLPSSYALEGQSCAL